MTSKSCSIAALAVLFAVLFLACATTQNKENTASREYWADAQLTPTERLLVKRDPVDKAFVVVENDTPEGDIFLRAKAIPLDPTAEVSKHLAERMLTTVLKEQGVGIAGPQVGISRQIIVVKRLDLEPEQPYLVYYNPTITEVSTERVTEWEGCLSIPAGFGQVTRPQSIVLHYQKQDGSWTSEQISDFTARIFQHEIDHLNGGLFIDIKEAGELMPEHEYREMRERQKLQQQPSSASSQPVS